MDSQCNGPIDHAKPCLQVEPCPIAVDRHGDRWAHERDVSARPQRLQPAPNSGRSTTALTAHPVGVLKRCESITAVTDATKSQCWATGGGIAVSSGRWLTSIGTGSVVVATISPSKPSTSVCDSGTAVQLRAQCRAACKHAGALSGAKRAALCGSVRASSSQRLLRGTRRAGRTGARTADHCAVGRDAALRRSKDGGWELRLDGPALRERVAITT